MLAIPLAVNKVYVWLKEDGAYKNNNETSKSVEFHSFSLFLQKQTSIMFDPHPGMEIIFVRCIPEVSTFFHAVFLSSLGTHFSSLKGTGGMISNLY